jgi:hypothetical protein
MIRAMRLRAGMPEDRVRRPRGWAIVVAGFVAIAAYLVATHVVLVHQRADMRGAVSWIVGELVALAALWSMRGLGSLPLRAAVTTCIGIPVLFVVGFFGLFGDIPPDYRWEQAPAQLHVSWLGCAIAWSLVCGFVLPAVLAVYDAIAQFARRE